MQARINMKQPRRVPASGKSEALQREGTMALVTRFDTPGRLRDLPDSSPFYVDWHEEISWQITSTGESALMSAFEPPVPGSGFYNASLTEMKAVGTRALVWMGFPRDLLLDGSSSERREAFRKGDTRGVATADGRTTQVEYLEWFTERDARGRIRKVTFTTEIPEYWAALFRSPGGPERVLELYRELLGHPEISLSEITDEAGKYDPLNPWNTERGIIHYIVERASGEVNTLGGAMNLAALGAYGPLVSDNFQLSGSAPTSSDPRVTLDARCLTRKGVQITLAEPIGLYMGGWDDTGWSKPDGRPVDNYWKVERPGGASGPPALRLVYEVPVSEGFVVGDIRIGGRPIEFGGQIAEHVTVMFYAVVGTLP